jgi:hypothetical protein
MYDREWLDWIELTANMIQKQSVMKLAMSLRDSWETASFIRPAEHLDKNGCSSFRGFDFVPVISLAAGIAQ